MSLPAGNWLEMTGLILVGLLPFAALGIALGHLLNVDSIGPAMGGLTGWLVMAGCTLVLATLAAYAYRRDTGRV